MDELLRKLIEELEAAADRTHMAQSLYHQAILSYDDVNEKLTEVTTLLKAQAANKEMHPALSNTELRDGFVTLRMGEGKGKTLKERLGETKTLKLTAQAEYDFRRRRQADLRAIVQALTKD